MLKARSPGQPATGESEWEAVRREGIDARVSAKGPTGLSTHTVRSALREVREG